MAPKEPPGAKGLKPCLGKFAALYLDDIVIFSKSLEEHAKHLEQVLQCLQNHNFKAKMSKCEFSQQQLQFLGHIITAKGSSIYGPCQGESSQGLARAYHIWTHQIIYWIV